MRKWICAAAVVVALLLGGCSDSDADSIHGNAIIDWVDFVKLNEYTYTGLFDGVIKNPLDVTDEVAGEVKFKVGDVVTNPKYRTKPGDAAFLAIGTKLYRVKGFEPNELIAAKEERLIGGYRLYAEENFAKTLQLNYKDVPKDKVERVELYRLGEVEAYRTLTGSDQERFIQLLDSGADTQDYTPADRDRDPTYYSMVFYTDGPIAYLYSIADDGENVFFSPWTTRLVDDEIRVFLQP
jgi:hypothetical protein